MAQTKKITISFKNTTKDMQLYTILKSLEEQSGTIKKILADALMPDIEPKK
jgi:hypothetical protein